MSTLFTDSGTGSNANPIGGAYTTLTGFSDIQRLSNLIEGTASSSNHGAYVNSVTPPNNQWMQCSLQQAADSSNGGGVMVRVQTGSASGYGMQIFGASNPNTVALFRFDSGSYTQLDSTTITYAPGDVFYLEIQGTTLIGKVNGVQKVTATDATYASGRLGLYLYSAPSNFINLVTGGDFGGSTPLTQFYYNMAN